MFMINNAKIDRETLKEAILVASSTGERITQISVNGKELNTSEIRNEVLKARQL